MQQKTKILIIDSCFHINIVLNVHYLIRYLITNNQTLNFQECDS